ncbi:MAG: WG repeat-containing protein [Bacteroidota bacterium]
MKRGSVLPGFFIKMGLGLFVLLNCVTLLAQDEADTLVSYNKNNKWGFITRNATNVTFRIAPVYEAAYPFYEGRAAVMKNGLWGFIDAAGREVIPFEFPEAKRYRFNKGLIAVKKGVLYGVIDKTGKTVLPFDFQDATVYGDAGVIVAKVRDTKDPSNFTGLAGMYNFQGTQLLPHEYNDIDPAARKNAVALTKNDLRSLANAKGEMLTAKWYKTLVYSDISHFIAANDGQYDLFDANGRLIFSYPSGYVSELKNNRASFKGPNGKYGYLDGRGQVAIQPQFDYISSFNEGLALIQHIGGGVDVIDSLGKIAGTVANGDLNYSFKQGIVWIRQRPPSFQYYAYDRSLNKVFPTGYSSVSSFDENGLAVVGQDKKKGLINKLGQVVLPLEYRNINAGLPGHYIVTTPGDSTGIVTAGGAILFKPQKLVIDVYDKDFYRIRPAGFYFMNDNGNYFCMYRKDGVYYYDQNP